MRQPKKKDFSLEYQPSSPTVLAFHNSKADFKLLSGPFGSGKSVCCLWDCLMKAMRQVPDKYGIRKHRTAVVRETYNNLKKSAVKTFNDWMPPECGQLVGQSPIEATYKIPMPDGTTVHWEVMLFPIKGGDKHSDGIDSIKSLEVSSAYFMEISENDQQVVDAMVSRIGRYPSMKDGVECTEPGIVGDFNLPGKAHWLYKTCHEGSRVRRQKILDENGVEVEIVYTFDYFEQPPAVFCTNIEEVEQHGVKPEYHLNPNADNLSNLRRDYYFQQLKEYPTPKEWNWMKANLMMIWTAQRSGKLVYENSFKRQAHVHPEPIQPDPQGYTLIGMDTSGFYPGAVIGQPMAGRMCITDEIFADNVPFESFVQQYLLPVLRTRYSQAEIFIVCDPSNPRETRFGVTPVQQLHEVGLAAGPAPTNAFEIRKESVNRMLASRTGLCISPTCSLLIDGFENSYVYKQLRGVISSTNQPVFDTSPDKTQQCSHVHDALQYLCTHWLQELSGGGGGTTKKIIRPRRPKLII